MDGHHVLCWFPGLGEWRISELKGCVDDGELDGRCGQGEGESVVVVELEVLGGLCRGGVDEVGCHAVLQRERD